MPRRPIPLLPEWKQNSGARCFPREFSDYISIILRIIATSLFLTIGLLMCFFHPPFLSTYTHPPKSSPRGTGVGWVGGWVPSPIPPRSGKHIFSPLHSMPSDKRESYTSFFLKRAGFEKKKEALYSNFQSISFFYPGIKNDHTAGE